MEARGIIPSPYPTPPHILHSLKVKNALATYCLLCLLVNDIKINSLFSLIITQDAFSIIKSIQDAHIALSKNDTSYSWLQLATVLTGLH